MDDYDDDTPVASQPHDLLAEQAYLGALLFDPRRVREHHRLLSAGDFYRPAHGLIHQTIGRMIHNGQAADPLTVSAALQAAGDLTRAGGASYLHTCVHAMPTAANAEYYADRIRGLALRRALIAAGTDIAGEAWSPDGDPADIAERAVAAIRHVRDAGRAAEDTPVLDLYQFLDGEDEPYDWVLPGLLERGDRVIWTAAEGGGKSVLQRQLAVSAAAGAMPFSFDANAYGPQKVLVLDCENSRRQTRRQYRALRDIAENRHTPVKPSMLHIDIEPGGIDLTRPAGRSWLMRRVEATMPALLVIGPIYRLHNGDPNSEEHARAITVVLDEARAVANCAISLEAHSPQAAMGNSRALRPVGSSLWLRWPEFGLGLRPVEDERSADEDRARRLIPWRGGRDHREWPAFLRGGLDAGWPWRTYQPIDADYLGNSSTGATG